MIARDLLNLLKEKNLTISSMESLTGGLFASTITSIAGASKCYKGSFVTYTNEIKNECGVKKETIDQYGVISFECVKEMAICSKKYFDTDIAISFSGNAGPEASDGKEVGLVYIAILIDKYLYSYKLHFKGERNFIRNECVNFACKKLIEILKNY